MEITLYKSVGVAVQDLAAAALVLAAARERGTSAWRSSWRRSTHDEFSPGLAGVVAFETEIAEPDKEGGELRYRGVNIEELVGKVPFEQVWGLLVDESLEPGLPAAYCELEHRTGSHMSDLQAALASSAASGSSAS